MTDRMIRITALIQEKIATFIREEANTDPLITVTSINVSPDMKNATVFITTIPDGREEDALIFLKRHGKTIRKKLMKSTYMKVVPFLDFKVDVGEKHRQHIDEIVNETGTKSTYDIEGYEADGE